MNLPALQTLKTELIRNGHTIGISVSISLILFWISSPGVIFLVAIAAILIAMFLNDVRDRWPPPRNPQRRDSNSHDPYDSFDDDEPFHPHNNQGG